MNDVFAKWIYDTIIEDGSDIYKNLFDTTIVTSRTTKYWKTALNLYHSLDESEKEVFLSVIKQIMVDSVSSVLGILDGTSTLNGGNLEFRVLINGKCSNNELQNSFLRYVEDNLDCK